MKQNANSVQLIFLYRPEALRYNHSQDVNDGGGMAVNYKLIFLNL